MTVVSFQIEERRGVRNGPWQDMSSVMTPATDDASRERRVESTDVRSGTAYSPPQMSDGAGQRTVYRWLLSIGFLLLGVAAVSWIVRDAGVDTTYRLIRQALPWLPLALAIEGTRIGCELLASARMFRLMGRPIPFLSLLRGQFAGYVLGSVVPMGRTAAEATKAAIW